MLDHGLVPHGHLAIVLQVNELFEHSQVLVQLTLDHRLSCRELQLVSIVKLSQTKVVLNLVDGLLDQRTALLAHDVEEEEFQVAFISRCDHWDQLCLNEVADPLKIDKIALKRSVLHLKDIQESLQSEL